MVDFISSLWDSNLDYNAVAIVLLCMCLNNLTVSAKVITALNSIIDDENDYRLARWCELVLYKFEKFMAGLDKED